MFEKMMKAQVLRAPYLLDYVDVPVPTLDSGDILVGVKVCTISQMDRLLFTGACKAKTPLIPGQEIQGVVEALGADVSGFSIGDRVVVLPSEKVVRMPKGGEPMFLLGGLAEYMKAPASECLKIPDMLDDFTAATLPRAWRQMRNVLKFVGEPATPCILDVDRSNLLLISVARFLGFAPIIVVGGEGRMLEAAKELGADWCFTTSEANRSPKSILDKLPQGQAPFVISAYGEMERQHDWDPRTAMAQVGSYLELPAALLDTDPTVEAGAKDLVNRVMRLLVYARIDPKPLYTKAVSLKDVGDVIREWKKNTSLLQVFYKAGLHDDFVFENAEGSFSATIAGRS